MTTVDDGVQTKVCTRCREPKPTTQFYWNNSKQIWYEYCKACMSIRNKENAAKRRAKGSAGLSRVQMFIQRFTPLSELTDEEIKGSFIYDEHGQKVSIHELPKVFQTKFSSELSIRLNAYLRQKTPRALEVIFEIIDSDLVEPSDRLKASQWWVERIIGKTPEKLEMSIGGQPHETIFENLSGGSREAHRAQAIGQAIDAEVIEDYEEANVDEVQLSGNESVSTVDAESKVEEHSKGKQDLSTIGEKFERPVINTDNSVGTKPESNETILHDMQSRTVIKDSISTEEQADKIVDKKKEIQELKKRIAEQKRRRYAARAVGASSLEAMGLLIDWRVHEDGLRACLVMPSSLTPAKLAVIEANDEQTDDEQFVLNQRAIILANKYAKEAEKLKVKAERIKKNGL